MVQGPSMFDRLDGVNEGIAKKAPVRAATRTNVTLSGLQTVDTVVLAEGDRVLVRVNTDATENGVYNASSGEWTRALDFDGNRDIVHGSMVFVTEGEQYQATEWYVASEDPITIDESEINFVQWSGGGGFPNATYWTVNDESSDLPNSRQSAAGTGITITDSGPGNTITVAASTNLRRSGIFYEIDGGGSVIATGLKAMGIRVPFNCTITSVTLCADQVGDIVVDIWKDTLGNYPPTNADSICNTTKPTLSSQTNSQDTTLGGWVVNLSVGDILRFNVLSAVNVTRVDVNIALLKS